MLIGDDLHVDRNCDGSVTFSSSGLMTTVSKEVWASIIATLSYYGEQDYGWFRAMNFHSGTPIDFTTVIIKKEPLW